MISNFPLAVLIALLTALLLLYAVIYIFKFIIALQYSLDCRMSRETLLFCVIEESTEAHHHVVWEHAQS